MLAVAVHVLLSHTYLLSFTAIGTTNRKIELSLSSKQHFCLRRDVHNQKKQEKIASMNLFQHDSISFRNGKNPFKSF